MSTKLNFVWFRSWDVVQLQVVSPSGFAAHAPLKKRKKVLPSEIPVNFRFLGKYAPDSTEKLKRIGL